MLSGVGGLPANRTPATWPSGRNFKERDHATALKMRGFSCCAWWQAGGQLKCREVYRLGQ